MKPIIYQLFPRWFGNKNTTRKHDGSIEENGCGKFNDLDAATLRRIRSLGATHLWLTGIIRHATQTDYSRFGIPRQHPQVVKGRAGSPYAIADYYDVDPDLAVDVEHRMEEFEALVGRAHAHDMKVVIDFVPNHVARQYQSIGKPDGERDLGEDDDPTMHFSTHNNYYYLWGQPLELSFLAPSSTDSSFLVPRSSFLDKFLAPPSSYEEIPAKATGNDQFSNRPSRNDWYETIKLNYGVDYCDAGGRSEHFDPIPDTWQKMLNILLFWASKDIDAFRCDMVFMVPVAFWKWAISQVKNEYPNIKFIGEIYDPAIYRSYIGYGGFDYLYDKVGLYDTLRAVVECRESASAITRCWQSVDDIQDRMLNFLENHDEQRVASDFFAGDARKALPAFVVSALMRTNPFMLYFGQELGERGMDAEGFSGRDGRTTIFDYWALASMQAWIGAKHDYRMNRIGQEQREIRDYYATILGLSQRRPFAEGTFFDLTYCNYGNASFDIHRQYAFLRHAGGETVLVVANFDADEKHVAVNIPAEAWDYVNIMADGKCHLRDLIQGVGKTVDLVRHRPFELTVPGYGARVISLTESSR